MLENRMLRRMFGLTRCNNREKKKLHHEGLHSVFLLKIKLI
jgi:hypothetical protein